MLLAPAPGKSPWQRVTFIKGICVITMIAGWLLFPFFFLLDFVGSL